MQSQNKPQVNLTPGINEYNWWQHPLPLAENAKSAVLMQEGMPCLPVSSHIAKMHPIYANKQFTGLQLENYVSLARPTICGWVKDQPMPFNVLPVVLQDMQQLTSSQGDCIFDKLAHTLEETQFAMDNVVDALLNTLSDISAKKNFAAQQVTHALSKISLAQKELQSVVHTLFADKARIENTPYVADAILLSIPTIIQQIIQAQMQTVEYCAAMLCALDKLTQVISQFKADSTNKKTDYEKIINYIRENLSPALVRNSYDLLSGNKITLQGNDIIFPVDLLSRHSSHALSSAPNNIPLELYVFSLLLHLTKEQVLASFVPYIRSFTQPDTAFAQSHVKQITQWITNPPEQKDETEDAYIQVMQQAQSIDLSYTDALQEMRHLEEKIVRQLSSMMNGSVNDQSSPFYLQLENIHTPWVEKIAFDSNSLYWKKDKKAEAMAMSGLWHLKQPLLVKMRIEMEVRKLPTKPVLMHPAIPDSVDYDRLILLSQQRMQWYGRSYLFQTNGTYQISDTPLSPTLTITIEDPSAPPASASIFPSSQTNRHPQEKKEKKNFTVKFFDSNNTALKKEETNTTQEMGHVPVGMKLTLQTTQTISALKRLTFSLKTTASQHITMQQILLLYYPECIDQIYFTPFQPTRSGCNVVLEVHRDVDPIKYIEENRFLREIMEDHFPHQEFSEFIHHTRDKITSLQSEHSFPQHIANAYLDYAPPKQIPLLPHSGVTTPIEESRRVKHHYEKSFTISRAKLREVSDKEKIDNTLLGFFFKFTQKTSGTNQNFTLDADDYSEVVLAEYSFDRPKISKGIDLLEYLWKGQVDFRFAFQEMQPGSQRDGMKLMQYQTTFNSSKKSYNHIAHVILNDRRQYQLLFSKNVVLAGFEIWKLSGPSPELRTECIYRENPTLGTNLSVLPRVTLQTNNLVSSTQGKVEEIKEISTAIPIEDQYEEALRLLQDENHQHAFARSLMVNENHERFKEITPEVTFLEKAMADLPPYFFQRDVAIKIPHTFITQLAYAIFSTRILIKKDLLEALSKFKLSNSHQTQQLLIRKQLQDESFARPVTFGPDWIQDGVVDIKESRFTSLLNALGKRISLPTEDQVVKEICEHLEEYSQGNFVNFGESLSHIEQVELLYLQAIVQLTPVSIHIYYNNQVKKIESQNAKQIISLGYVTGVRYVNLKLAVQLPLEEKNQSANKRVNSQPVPVKQSATTQAVKLLPPIKNALYSKAVALRDKMNIDININLLEQALTLPKSPHSNQHSRLAFLGDCYIKYAVTCYLYIRFPDMNEKDMWIKRTGYVKNETMIISGLKRELTSDIRLPADDLVTGQKYIADTVEAIIGAAYLTGGEAMAKSTMAWFDLPSDFTLWREAPASAALDSTPDQMKTQQREIIVRRKNLAKLLENYIEKKCLLKSKLQEKDTQAAKTAIEQEIQQLEQSYTLAVNEDIILAQRLHQLLIIKNTYIHHFNLEQEEKFKALCQSIAALEKQTGYTFQNKSLLLESMTHNSYLNRSSIYTRLEALGDAIVDFITKLKLFIDYPDASVSELGKNLFDFHLKLHSIASVRTDLSFMLVANKDFEREINTTKEAMEKAIALQQAKKDNVLMYPVEITPHYIFKTQFKTRIAAVYIDSKFSLAKAMQVYDHLVGTMPPHYNYLLDKNQKLYAKHEVIEHARKHPEFFAEKTAKSKPINSERKAEQASTNNTQQERAPTEPRMRKRQ